MAFGLTEFDNTSEFVEDPDYALLKAKYRGWDQSPEAQEKPEG